VRDNTHGAAIVKVWVVLLAASVAVSVTVYVLFELLPDPVCVDEKFQMPPGIPVEIASAILVVA
jgi:hypothetical protein